MVLGSHVQELAHFLDRCRVKRHDLIYEASDAVSSAEAQELAEAVLELREAVEAWLREYHPELVT